MGRLQNAQYFRYPGLELKPILTPGQASAHLAMKALPTSPSYARMVGILQSSEAASSVSNFCVEGLAFSRLQAALSRIISLRRFHRHRSKISPAHRLRT